MKLRTAKKILKDTILNNIASECPIYRYSSELWEEAHMIMRKSSKLRKWYHSFTDKYRKPLDIYVKYGDTEDWHYYGRGVEISFTKSRMSNLIDRKCITEYIIINYKTKKVC